VAKLPRSPQLMRGLPSRRDKVAACALNIGTEEGTRKQRWALLESDDDDEDLVPLSRVFRVRRSSRKPTPPPQASSPEAAQTGRQTPPQETTSSRHAQGPPPRTPTPPRAGPFEAASTRTGEAASGAPELSRALAEKAERENRPQSGNGSTRGRGGAGRRFSSWFRRSDM
jgi:hypothetical protein